MRAITADLKVIVGRLGPLVSKALEASIRRAVEARHPEVTPEHFLRALLDFADSDLAVSMANARIERKDLVARLDWHLGRLHGQHEGKPRLSHALCLLLDDAAKLTSDRVRSGHVTTALLADPSLSTADMAKLLDGLPRLSLHLLASKVEDRGDVGKVLPSTPSAPAAAPAATTISTPASPAKAPAPAAAAPATPAMRGPVDEEPDPDAETRPIRIRTAGSSSGSTPPAEAPIVASFTVRADLPSAPAPSRPVEPMPSTKPKPVEPMPSTKPEPAPPAGRTLKNLADLRTIVTDRLVSEDARGMTLTAQVEGRETTLRLEWDLDQRVLALRILLPGAPPADAVRTAVALSTLNNALPFGAFVAEGERLAFRSHVFLDADGTAPLETLVFAIQTCEEAAEAML